MSLTLSAATGTVTRNHPSVTVAELTGTCTTCAREWPESDLHPDRDGDPMCVDCHRSDTSAEDYAAYRSFMGR